MIDQLWYTIYRDRYINAPSQKPDHPIDVSIELAAACDSRCTYCYWAEPKNLPFKPGMMKRELALNIVEECAESGVHSLKTNFRGEGTLNPCFEEVTAKAKDLAWRGTLIDRITNSNFQFRRNRESIFRGLNNQTKVKVSFDSFIKEVYEKQRKGSNYEPTLKNIDDYYNHPDRDNKLVIQAVRTTLNKDEDLEGEIKKRWRHAIVSIRDVVGGRNSKDISDLSTMDRDDSERQSCIQAHSRLMIRWDGLVGSCCPDTKGEIVLGDIKKETMLNIWNGEKALALRKSLLDKTAFENSPCKNCSSFETYKGYKIPRDS
jgi:radical SAM protein with 4Fe4S-binding SPASM domain